jgi:glycosyltransferase involved in cell wall biosynthesis
MTLLSLFYKHKRGGFNKRLYKLYLALAVRAHVVHYIAVEDFPITHPNIIKHILWTPFRKKENLLFWGYFILMAPLYCMWIAIKNKVNKIIVFSSFYAFICSLTSILLRIKMVTFLRADVLRESYYERKSHIKNLGNALFESIGLKVSCLIVSNSKTLMQSISDRHKNLNSTVLPNNIEQEHYIKEEDKKLERENYGLSQDHFLIITASPLNRVKNIEFLIKAFSQVGIDRARLIIVGEDLNNTGERTRLEKMSINLGISSHTVFTGWLNEPIDIIATADLFVFPSQQEGSPNALLEALSCNVVCLGSRISEIAEILKYDELLFSLSSTEELTRKICKIILDRSYAGKLLALARERKKDYLFNWDQQAAKIVLEA